MIPYPLVMSHHCSIVSPTEYGNGRPQLMNLRRRARGSRSEVCSTKTCFLQNNISRQSVRTFVKYTLVWLFVVHIHPFNGMDLPNQTMHIQSYTTSRGLSRQHTSSKLNKTCTLSLFSILRFTNGHTRRRDTSRDTMRNPGYVHLKQKLHSIHKLAQAYIKFPHQWRSEKTR